MEDFLTTSLLKCGGVGSAIAVLLFISVTPIMIFNIRSILKERAN